MSSRAAPPADARKAPRAATDELRRLERGGPGWPAGLADLGTTEPRSLWVRGDPRLPDAPAVALVGSRRPSLVGLRTAARLAAELGRLGVPVVSGMALGIDGAAHRGALDGGGVTVAVLGCGADVCYPRHHRRLRDAIAATGWVVSEEAPGTEPVAWHFPKRNRIIAALAVAVVVVEAGEASGALSTAAHAQSLDRAVLAVPGSVASEMTRGSNGLLRDGAGVVLDVLDVLAATPALRHLLDRTRLVGGGGPDGSRDPQAPSPRTLAGRLLDLAAGGPVHPEALAAGLAASPATVARLVGELELAGHLLRAPGGRVEAVTVGSDRGGWVHAGTVTTPSQADRIARRPLL